MKKHLLSISALFISFLVFGQPTDNPYKSQYGQNAPVWTDSLLWTTVVSISDFKLPTQLNCDTALQDAFNALGSAGGVVFFPAGSYTFANDIVLPSKVILRGEAPTQLDAREANFAPPSRLIFPQYIPTFSGAGTDNSSAFKSITTSGDVQNCALVHLDINRGRISLGTTASKHILIFGVRQNNIAQPDAGVPDLTYMNGWQRFSYRHTFNISAYGEFGVSVSCCRVNDLLNNTVHPIADDSYDQPGYIAKGTYIGSAETPNGATSNGITTITHGERARFNYLNHYGIKVNGKKMNPSDNDVPINQQVELIDNWVYTTMRVSYFAEAIGLIVRGNVKKDQAAKMGWLEATGKSLIYYNGNTLENRALNFAGENILIENNDFEVYRHKMVNTKYYSTDGEGIMIQYQDAWGLNTGSPARMRDITIRNNRVSGYIGIYDVQVPISNVVITGNDLRANEDITGRTDGTIMIFKKETNHRVDKVLIENNVHVASIALGWKNTATNTYEMSGSNIVVRNNTGVDRLGISIPYQTVQEGNTAYNSISSFATDQLLPIYQVPYQMQYNANQTNPIFVEFAKAIEAVDLSQITIGRTSDGLVTSINAAIDSNKLVLTPIESLIMNDIDTISIPANSIKFVGENTQNENISWYFRVGNEAFSKVGNSFSNHNSSFYPNPSKGSITVQTGMNQTIAASIYTLNGTKVLENKVADGDNLNTEKLLPGVYVLRLGDRTHKLVVID